jgi:hypothetical protein
MSWSLTELISIIVTIVGSVWASHIKLKDEINEAQNQSNVSKAILDQVVKDIHTIQRDIHNLALIIGTERAKAEEARKGKK